MAFIKKEDVIAIEYNEEILCSDCEEEIISAEDEKEIITHRMSMMKSSRATTAE